MSLRPCNYCTHKRLVAKQAASTSRKIITTRKGKDSVSVYKHYPEIDLESLTHRQRFKYWICSFDELPDRCCCD